MALSDEETATLDRLFSQLTNSQPVLERFDAYYEGVHRLERLGLAVPPELERFVTVVNWPRVTADSVEQRCDVEGFRLPGSGDADDELWNIWQANDLDEESQQGHLESLNFGRAYVCVGARGPDDDQMVASGDGDVPLITVESPFEMIHEQDPRTRRVTAAARIVRGSNVDAHPMTSATLYLPDKTVWLENSGSSDWTEVDRDEHGVGWPLVVPLLNRPRLRRQRHRWGHVDPQGSQYPYSSLEPRRRDGMSELVDVISLTDAACRALTNAQVATEVLAVPQRYVIGATPQDFVDQDGQPVTQWETYFGSVWALANQAANVGQFSAADLSNFETIVNHYANLVSGVSGLPTRFYGQYTANPPSSDSIVADETRLIMNAYRKQRGWGGSWERVMRLSRRIVDGDWNPDLSRMETLWRSPETPTVAQTADAAVKLFTAGIIPKRQARQDIGYTAVQIANMEQEDDKAAQADPLLKAADAFRLQQPIPGDTAEGALPAVAPGSALAAPPRVPGVPGTQP